MITFTGIVNELLVATTQTARMVMHQTETTFWARTLLITGEHLSDVRT